MEGGEWKHKISTGQYVQYEEELEGGCVLKEKVKQESDHTILSNSLMIFLYDRPGWMFIFFTSGNFLILSHFSQ
jgi:demethoxyubiquinone hydroxylase (CLK1/Coq7/Cat5 family)